MSELEAAAGAWREILHLSEWSGLSLGALAGLAALFYFAPVGRGLLLAAGVTVAVGWGAGTMMYAQGAADKQKQWDAARAAALEEQVERDTRVERELEQKYQPKLKALQEQADQHKARADAYESKLLEQWSAKAVVAAPKAGARAPADRCQLGAAADRLPGRQ